MAEVRPIVVARSATYPEYGVYCEACGATMTPVIYFDFEREMQWLFYRCESIHSHLTSMLPLPRGFTPSDPQATLLAVENDGHGGLQHPGLAGTPARRRLA